MSGKLENIKRTELAKQKVSRKGANVRRVALRECRISRVVRYSPESVAFRGYVVQHPLMRAALPEDPKEKILEKKHFFQTNFQVTGVKTFKKFKVL